MNKLRQLSLVLLSMLFVGALFIIPVITYAAHQSSPISLSSYQGGGTSWTRDLVTADSTVVGTIDFKRHGSTLDIDYTITDPDWCLVATDIAVGDNPADLGSIVSTDSHDNLNCATTDAYSVSVGHTFTVVANATSVVEEDFEIGDIEYSVYGGGSDSYLAMAITSDTINGVYPAWCVDLDHYISYLTYLGATIPTVGDEANPSIVDRPENMDLINYILNQHYTDLGVNYYDVQLAIWMLIDDVWLGQEGQSYSETANQIVFDAQLNGEGFVPGCGQVAAVILDPDLPDVQVTIIEFPLNCNTVSASATLIVEASSGGGPKPTDVPPTTEPEPTATAVPPTTEPGPTATNVPPTAVPPTAEPTEVLLGCQKNNPDRLDCSSLRVSASCDGTTAVFTITNTGEAGNGDMRQATQYRIYESDQQVSSGSVLLNGGTSMEIRWDADGPVRLEADQQVGHPGNSSPRATINCNK